MKKNSVAFIFNIFLGIGLVMLCVVIYLTWNIRKFENAATRTEGVVVDLIERRKASGSRRSVTWSPVVTYYDSAGVKHRYIPDYSSKPPAWKTGEQVRVYYNPKNPDEAKIGGWGEYMGVLITGGLGLIFTLIGGGYYIAVQMQRSRRNRLMQTGMLVQAGAIKVDVNRNITVNRQHPYFIRCEWKDTLTGQTHSFKSGFIWQDPSPLLRADTRINVYIDRDHPRKYYVDVTPFETRGGI
ncbi:DUF3592 domain-containing protein [Chitinophaga sp. Mgbs1]|uniref:DUF3592 domain-containing protein n=1 Tax=Chitinophaga solisilvae TaxID=1233460 RepID=A0A3S1B1I8_9BACT|nr:DUF3592 domain-containing protein [Chitinophaga solisilvae]